MKVKWPLRQAPSVSLMRGQQRGTQILGANAAKQVLSVLGFGGPPHH